MFDESFVPVPYLNNVYLSTRYSRTLILSYNTYVGNSKFAVPQILFKHQSANGRNYDYVYMPRVNTRQIVLYLRWLEAFESFCMEFNEKTGLAAFV